MTGKLPHVTDHALIRYLERVKGLDVEGVRRHIAEICKGVVIAKCVRAEGHDFILKAGTVVTVKPTGAINPRKVPRGRPALRNHAEVEA